MPQEDLIYGGGLVTERGLRRMSRWGYAVFAVWAATLLVWGIVSPEPHALGWWLALDNLLAGRGVCLYEGIRLGFGRLYLVLQCGGQDLAMTLITVPWIIRFHHHVSRSRFFDRFLRQVDAAAEKNQERLQGFGAVGLFCFAFMPTAGPMMGSVVGYLLGMPMRRVLPAVLAGHVTSLLVFMTFFNWLEPTLRSTNEGLAKYFAWIGLALVLLVGWLYRTARKHLARRHDETPESVVLGEAEAGMEASE